MHSFFYIVNKVTCVLNCYKIYIWHYSDAIPDTNLRLFKLSSLITFVSQLQAAVDVVVLFVPDVLFLFFLYPPVPFLTKIIIIIVYLLQF